MLENQIRILPQCYIHKSPKIGLFLLQNLENLYEMFESVKA